MASQHRRRGAARRHAAKAVAAGNEVTVQLVRPSLVAVTHPRLRAIRVMQVVKLVVIDFGEDLGTAPVGGGEEVFLDLGLPQVVNRRPACRAASMKKLSHPAQTIFVPARV